MDYVEGSTVSASFQEMKNVVENVDLKIVAILLPSKSGNISLKTGFFCTMDGESSLTTTFRVPFFGEELARTLLTWWRETSTRIQHNRSGHIEISILDEICFISRRLV